MRVGMIWLMAWLLMVGSVMADTAPSKVYYVRYIINMDFLPPLIGEKKCERGESCILVKLEHFSVVLTAPRYGTDTNTGMIEIDCMYRRCALPQGQSSYNYSKHGRFIRFSVNDHLYNDGNRAVVRYAGTEIGEILLAY